jgi:peptidoglycan hydrolase-like protein with peptidoglycan-binding domain
MSMPGEPAELRRGDANEWVSELQRLLQLLEHFHRDPDGIFDADTELAVAQFQAAAGQTTDALVGHATWDALYAAAPAEHYGAVEPAFDEYGAGEDPVHDDHWVWDGERWVGASDGGTPPAVEDTTQEAGSNPPDERWRWDGSEWQPANQ